MTLRTTFLTHSPLKRMYNRPCRPTRVAPLVTPSVLTVEENFVFLFVQEEKILQPCQNEHNLLKKTAEKFKHHEKLTQKF